MHLTLEQQVHSLHHRNGATLIFNILNGVLFCIIFRTEFSLWSLAVWYSALMIASMVRFAISWYYNRKDIVESEFIRSIVLYCVGMSLTIVVWASTSVFLFPIASVPHQFYLALTLCGILAQSTPILSVNKDIYRAFIILILAPLLLQLAQYATTEMHLALALVLLLFGLTVYKSAMFLATSFQRLHNISSVLTGLVSRDSLTLVANRRAFDERIQVEWKTANRHKTPLSLLMIDIDNFKSFNDTYGHQAGDHCIRRVAQVIGKSVLRGTDFVARYGGEEFSIILPATDARGAHTVAERVRHHVQLLRLMHKTSPASEYVTVSVGVATALPSKEGSSIQELIEAADKALYRSKNRGRNCVSTDADIVPALDTSVALTPQVA